MLQKAPDRSATWWPTGGRLLPGKGKPSSEAAVVTYLPPPPPSLPSPFHSNPPHSPPSPSPFPSPSLALPLFRSRWPSPLTVLRLVRGGGGGSESSNVRPLRLLGPGPLGSALLGQSESTALIRWPPVRGAASCLRRPAAREYLSRRLAGPAGNSLAVSRARRQYPVLARGPLVAGTPAASTPCWFTGCRH